MSTRRSFNVMLTVFATIGILANTGLVSAGELFHAGGTGKCEGCHFFGAEEGAQSAMPSVPDGTKPGAPGSTMTLRGSDPSSTSLRCHEAPNAQQQEYYVATSKNMLQSSIPPAQLTPGGDFGWLKKNYRWGDKEASLGERHGHNIVALDYGYVADVTLRNAPRGTYQAGNLSCTSCHDPHGQYRREANGSITTDGTPIVGSGSYNTSATPDASGSVGSYRLLAGKGYQPKSLTTITVFVADPPAAVAPASYNRPESAADTRVAYGSGMSEWCQNCHTSIHSDGGDRSGQHPSGNGARLPIEMSNTYNYYVASGNLNGTQNSAYTSMVPYEMGTGDYAVLKATANSNGSNLKGPETSANVMCLSCHRAHASGWDSMTRWNMKSTFLVQNGRYPGIDNGASPESAQGRTEAETGKTFYDRPANRYAFYQRSLCNKCHAKD